MVAGLNLLAAEQLAAGNAAASELQRSIQRVIRAALFPQLQAAAAAAAAAPAAAPARGAAEHAPAPAPAPAPASQPDARERRRLVQRCRLLKADIARFEGSFRASRGREPKSAAERGTMGAVYDEYRALKQTIRDGAATHIQSVFRGYRVRAAARGAASQPVGARAGPAGTAAAATSATAAAPAPAPAAAPAAASAAAAGPAASLPIPASSSSAASLSTSLSSSAVAAAATAARPTIALPSAAPPAPENMRLSALRDEKASLKRRLRQFDIDFAGTHGGAAPSKADKEHLRPQYTRYHELKAVIAEAEAQLGVGQRGRAGGCGGGSGGGEPYSPPTERASAGGGSGVGSGSGAHARARSESGGSAAVGLHDEDDDDASAPAPGAGAGTASSEVLDKVAALKAEKKKLQAALREYEKDFEARNGRPVKYVKDISTVVASYQRYKQLKSQLKELV